MFSMWVVKASGETEKFDKEKIKRTCLRAGASQKLATKISKQVESKAYDGISTKDILDITLKLLRKEMIPLAARYDLKGAMFRLGPAGFAFENLVAEILKEYGYETIVHSMIRGACIYHEIDITATKMKMGKQPKVYMIECKYHNLPGVYTKVKDILYTYARFLDLAEGYKKNLCQKFNKPWLVCNTKFSEDTIQYANCKNILLTGWRYPSGSGLEKFIEKKKLYPITMLRKLDKYSQEKLATVGLVLAIDLIRKDIKELNKITSIPINKLKTLSKEAEMICYG